MYTLLKIAFVFLFFFTRSVSAYTGFVPFGYVDNVKIERTQPLGREINLDTKPLPQKILLHDKIFAPKLAREFRERYRQKFGQLDFESPSYQPTEVRTVDPRPQNSRALVQENIERREFGEFMLRRLTEFHVDNWIQTDPDLRPVYEAKEKLQNIKVEINKTTRINLVYSFAGNYFDLIIDNPYLDTKVVIQMDPNSLFPTAPQDSSVVFTKPLNSRDRVNNIWSFYSSTVSVEFVRKWSHSVSTSLTQSTIFYDVTKDNRLAAGVSYIF